MKINRQDKEVEIETDNLLEWLTSKRFERIVETSESTEKLVDIILSSTPSHRWSPPVRNPLVVT